MTDHPTIADSTAARAAIAAAETAAHCTRAITTLDAIHKHAAALELSELDDLADDVWQAFIGFDRPIPDTDVVDVFLRAAPYLSQRRVIALVAGFFGDRKVDIRLSGSRQLVWLPADRIVIATYARGIAAGHLMTTVIYSDKPSTRVA